MTEDELKKYKEDHIHAKKEHGKNAKKFKANKDRAKEQALQERLSNARDELSEVNGNINNLKTDKEALEGKIEALKGDKRTLEEEEEEIISKIETNAKEKIDAIEVPEEPKDTFGKREFYAVNSMLTALGNASKNEPIGTDNNGKPVMEVKFLIGKEILDDLINLLTRLKDLMNIYKAKEKAVQKIAETKASAREKLNIKQMIVKNKEQMKDINAPSDPSKSKKHEQSL
jgi:chromosome segregation ATPase